MAKKTTTDMLKYTLCNLHGGEAQDWVRVSKKKNADGKEVREFKNKKTGAKVMATQLDQKHYHVKRTDIVDQGVDMLVPVSLSSPSASFQKKATPAKSRGLTEEAAADKIIGMLTEGSDEEISENLLKKAGKALAGKFVFAIGEDDMLEGLYVRFAPVADEHYDQHLEHVIGHLLPATNGGELEETSFHFHQHTDPLALAKELMACGFTFDPAFQMAHDNGSGTPLMPRLQELVTGAAPSSGTVIETDPAKNAAADRAIAILMGDANRDDSDDASYGVPRKIIEEAGKALANRYCFAVCMEDGDMRVMITPILHFEKEGACSDQSGPIGDLLPRCAEAMESTWEIYDESVKTPVDAVKYLQQLGFVWNKDFQDFIDKSLTKDLEAALESPVVKSVPAQFHQAAAKVLSAEEAANKVMEELFAAEGILEQGGDMPREWLDAAKDILPARFRFTLVEDKALGGLLVSFKPVNAPNKRCLEDPKGVWPVIGYLFPKAEQMEDQAEGLWKFPGYETGSLAAMLVKSGFVYDEKNQDKKLKKEIRAALPKKEKPASKSGKRPRGPKA